MTRRKKRFLYCLLALVVCGFLVAQGLRLVKTNDRPAPGTALSAQIKSQIGRECKSSKPEDFVKYSMRLTADLLSFTEKNDLDNGKANCVGYAVLCSRICNYAFQVNGMGYRAKPVVGYVSFYGVNLCRLLQAVAPQRWKTFVKDHEFVELQLEDRPLFFDASLYDFNLDCTTTRNNS